MVSEIAAKFNTFWHTPLIRLLGVSPVSFDGHNIIYFKVAFKRQGNREF
mgnify:CR=1 FL=1